MARSSKKTFVELPQFVQKIISKTTEVKNLVAQIQTLKTQKAALEANNQSTTQVQTQLSQKQNTLAKKVVKVETKVNAVVKKQVEVKVAQALGSIRENESGYDIVNLSLMTSAEISFNTSIYHRYVLSFNSETFIFGYAGTNYFGSKFVLFKGENAIDFSELSFQFANTTDSRGYYRHSNSNGVETGRIRTNWSKYKRSNSWCLYDAENDIMYYSNYSGPYIPTKKWYRADTLYKTEIELKIRSISSSGSGSGSGSGSVGAGVSIGISLIDQFLLGPIFGPSSIGQNIPAWDGATRQLYRNANIDSLSIMRITDITYVIDKNLYGLGTVGAIVVENIINYNNYNLPINGWKNVDGSPSDFVLTVIPVEEWIPIIGTANGYYNNSYWINNVKTSLDLYGAGFWNNKYYIGGAETTLDQSGTGFWNDKRFANGNLFTGLASDNTYWINGTVSSLNNSGTGAWNGKYYIGGVQTTLNPSGTGVWNNKYYISAVETTLPQSGIGAWNNNYYVYGIQTTLNQSGTGFWNNKYYIGGVETTLDQNGTGAWNSKYYIGGVETTLGQNGTGAWNSKYYIGGVETTLDQSGNGIWNDSIYQNGSTVTSFGDFTISPSDSNGIRISSWSGTGTSVEIPSSIFGIPVRTIGFTTFINKSSLTSVSIPNSVTSIGDQAFQSCTGLTSITIPNSVTSIGNYAFFVCSGLTGTLTIPNSVTSIGNYAFFGCAGLTGTLTIPNSVTSIGEGTFSACLGLSSFNVAIDNAYYSDDAGVLFNKDKTTLIKYPPGAAVSSYTIPNSVETISRTAFQGSSNLTSIIIPASVRTIKNSAFAGLSNSNLTTITIPNGVTTIEEYAFQGSSRITTLIISNTVTSIGNGAFSSLFSLTNLTIPQIFSTEINRIGINPNINITYT